jgi:hypothetical protein
MSGFPSFDAISCISVHSINHIVDSLGSTHARVQRMKIWIPIFRSFSRGWLLLFLEDVVFFQSIEKELKRKLLSEERVYESLAQFVRSNAHKNGFECSGNG